MICTKYGRGLCAVEGLLLLALGVALLATAKGSGERLGATVLGLTFLGVGAWFMLRSRRTGLQVEPGRLRVRGFWWSSQWIASEEVVVILPAGGIGVRFPILQYQGRPRAIHGMAIAPAASSGPLVDELQRHGIPTATC